ncbi:chorismate-binding protein [Luteolibacter flavescens]|uniref:Chorismate-binding protein n=1 Tax=Luteolibacter flavescens TaxID=1859460 RepID=A0ABT3FRJ7_9BACT|nr:chorismate-binding protein [Luteolibacter flavescens]MCW1885829.1 chorismate-binding protein [Luteolibacter flavescens]
MITDSIAFLDLPDGRSLVGRGPFTPSAKPPQEGVAFYRNDFGLGAAEPWLVPDRWEIASHGEVASLIGMAGGSPACTWEAPEASDFSLVFQEISAAIRGGTFEKTVPVVVERGTLEEAPGHRLLATAAGSSGPLLGYGFSDGVSGFAGASPELLLSVTGGVLKTMALAGTARTEERDVLAVDEKEIREHEYVAQSLVAKLGDIGEVRRGPRGILQLGSIVHFHTPIEVDLTGEESPAQLLRRLHPTPALGPLPRTPETLRQLIGWRRRLGTPEDFGAPFGAIVDGDFHAIVAIRGLWWQDREVILPAGCGVIEASRLVNEWRELRLKREAVKARFGL